MCSYIFDDAIYLKIVDLPKTQKFKYLEDGTLLFLQMKKFIHYIIRAIRWQKTVF